jgi:hypothetical protein
MALIAFATGFSTRPDPGAPPAVKQRSRVVGFGPDHFGRRRSILIDDSDRLMR